MYKKLCEIIEKQQQGKENTAAYYVGEQLKAMACGNDLITELLINDLQQADMSIENAEKQIKAYADKNRKSGANCVCVIPDKADKILREFYGLPKKSSNNIISEISPAAVEEAFIDLEKILLGDDND